MKLYLGIDLGTSNSAVAGIRDGRVVIYKTPEGTDVMPSVLYRDRRGNQVVGVRAYDQASMAPENCAQGFKRLMGTATPLRFASTAQTITPEEASAEILKSLVGQALLESGATEIEGAVITIPAAFNQMQSEATLAAARAAGLDRIALLQEPVAAAMAAMANARSRSGVFLVFDLGGGTFDVALVQAIDGSVTVLAHEGINMLGGRDLDRLIVDNLVTPWLMKTFSIPRGFQTEKRYERLVRVARRAAEDAKIALSTRDSITINASDDVIRLDDDRGEPIYIDVPMDRSTFEDLAGPKITDAIALCMKVLQDNGFTHEDVERVVLIGGPTKTPAIRRRVQDELGIAVEDISRVDPMTAVAVGAAIYCEGRNWEDEGSTAKATRASVSASGEGVKVSLDFQARTAGTKARLTARRTSGDENATIQVESLVGWSSGKRSLAAAVTLDLELIDMGPNRFRALVFDGAGRPVQSASREIIIERLLASAGGVPATQTIAVKVLDDAGKNTLEKLVPKGTELPARGKRSFRAAEPLKAGDTKALRLELFQLNDETIKDPELNLAVGEFRISAGDLPEGLSIRRGDEIIIHWEMGESQTVTAEIEIPAVSQRFDGRNFYDYQAGTQSFAGTEGGALVQQFLDNAGLDIERAEVAIPASVAAPLGVLRAQLEEQQSRAANTADPDERRSVVEEVRLVRQRIAAAAAHPDARAAMLRRSLDDEVRWYDKDVRPEASIADNERIDTLVRNARRHIDGGDKASLDLADRTISEVAGLYWRVGLGLPSFCAALWRNAREDRHLAKDRSTFERIVTRGDRALAAGDIAGVRAAFFELTDNLISVGAQRHVGERAALMRG